MFTRLPGRRNQEFDSTLNSLGLYRDQLEAPDSPEDLAEEPLGMPCLDASSCWAHLGREEQPEIRPLTI